MANNIKELVDKKIRFATNRVPLGVVEDSPAPLEATLVGKHNQVSAQLREIINVGRIADNLRMARLVTATETRR